MERDRSQVTVRRVRRDHLDDAAGVARVLNSVIAERRFTAMDGHYTPEAEQEFIHSLGPRSELFVAEVEGKIVGFQVFEPFVTYTPTMAHVGHMGTYVLAECRGQGIGRCLAEATLACARAHGYEKVVIYVLAHNAAGLGYYRALGFETLGTLKRQTKIDGVYFDELFLELHLTGGGE